MSEDLDQLIGRLGRDLVDQEESLVYGGRCSVCVCVCVCVCGDDGYM